MKKHGIFKTASVLSLTAGLILSSASAEHRPDGLSSAIRQVERSTDALFLDFKDELVHQRLWKPRGDYATIYSATYRMEDLGDTLRKYYEKRASLSSLARVAAKIEGQVHLAEDVARGCRLSRRFHSNLRSVSAVTHSLLGVCGSGADRSRGYGNERPRYDDQYRSRGPVYDRRPSRSVYPDIRRSRDSYSRGREIRLPREARRLFGFGF